MGIDQRARTSSPRSDRAHTTASLQSCGNASEEILEPLCSLGNAIQHGYERYQNASVDVTRRCLSFHSILTLLHSRIMLLKVNPLIISIPARTTAPQFIFVEESRNLVNPLDKLQREAFGCMPADVAMHYE